MNIRTITKTSNKYGLSSAVLAFNRFQAAASRPQLRSSEDVSAAAEPVPPATNRGGKLPRRNKGVLLKVF